MSSRAGAEEYRDFLEDMTCDYCEPKRYCILKEFLISAHPSPRLLMQIKAVDRLKYDHSKIEGKDIGWTRALELWVEKGYAKKFADFYEEGIKFSVLYKKIMNGNDKNKA